MRKWIAIAVLLWAAAGFAQEDAWVYFATKPGAAHYLANPLEMLSQKALDRRARQGISLDDKDVPLHQPYIDAVAAMPGITVMSRSKWLNALHVRGAPEAVEALLGLDFVDHIQFANRLLNTGGLPQAPSVAKKDLKLPGTLADYRYGMATNQVTMLNGHLLHQQDYTGKDITIAVLDSGFPGVNTLQPFGRLRTNGQLLGGYNYVGASPDVYTGGTHGTMVLSTMGGYAEGQLAGTAPDAFYYLFITEDINGENPVEESYWVEAAEAADSLGVDIINTSLGYFDFDNPSYNYTYADLDGQTAFITRGANVAFTRGILCVASAGNSGNTADPYVSPPADAPNTLTVGAVTAGEVRSEFSSTGPTADGRLKPDVMAQGRAAAVADASGAITTANGTSFSAPVIAGMAACLWQALPELTNSELLQLIRASADRYSHPDNQYGYGIPDFAWALQEVMGKGRKGFMLYPNPSRDRVYVLFPEGGQSATVTVFNSLGQLIMQQNLTVGSPAFSMQSLAAGVYLYRLEGGGVSQAGELIRE